jgi:hypothetical protein
MLMDLGIQAESARGTFRAAGIGQTSFWSAPLSPSDYNGHSATPSTEPPMANTTKSITANGLKFKQALRKAVQTPPPVHDREPPKAIEARRKKATKKAKGR